LYLNVQTISNYLTNSLSKYRVLEIKGWLCCIGDEKLTRICVWSTISHREHSSIGVPQMVLEFVFKFSVPYRIATFPAPRWVTSLYYEAFDISVKGAPVVVIRSTQRKEVFAGFRTVLDMKLDFDVADISVQSNRLK
jgi:hypothetical protein